jgi:hypothetical protein
LFTLTMKEGPTPGQRTDLQGSSLVLGRDPACNLVINDVEVSRRHARFIAQSGGYAIEDLGSTNGTFIDEQRIKGVVPLKPGASIRLGDRVSFIYESAPADEAGTQGVPVKQIKTSTTPRYIPVPKPPVPPAPMAPEPTAIETPELAAAPARRRPRRGGIRLPLFTQRWFMIGAVLLILGSCAAIFFFWYVDANYLWCDVFGGLISACR